MGKTGARSDDSFYSEYDFERFQSIRAIGAMTMAIDLKEEVMHLTAAVGGISAALAASIAVASPDAALHLSKMMRGHLSKSDNETQKMLALHIAEVVDAVLKGEATPRWNPEIIEGGRTDD